MRRQLFISLHSMSAALFLANERFSSQVAGKKLSPIHRKRKESIKDRRLVIGGDETDSGEYPYFAHYDSPGCGGSVRTLTKT